MPPPSNNVHEKLPTFLQLPLLQEFVFVAARRNPPSPPPLCTMSTIPPAPAMHPSLATQHMQSHVEFRTGQWHDASEANLRAVALPDSDASYPDHNMDMLM